MRHLSHLRIVRDIEPQTGNTEPERARAKALPLGESMSHVENNDGALSKERQANAPEDPATIRLRSKARSSWRLSGSDILRRMAHAAAVSIAELATMLDLQPQQLSRQLAGRDPFPVENFVGIAERNPWLGGEVIVAYATGCRLPADVIEVTGQRLIELAQQLRTNR